MSKNKWCSVSKLQSQRLNFRPKEFGSRGHVLTTTLCCPSIVSVCIMVKKLLFSAKLFNK